MRAAVRHSAILSCAWVLIVDHELTWAQHIRFFFFSAPRFFAEGRLAARRSAWWPWAIVTLGPLTNFIR